MYQASGKDELQTVNTGKNCRVVPEVELSYDEAKLLYWLRQRNIGEFIITIRKVDWDKFKKQLVLKDGQIIYSGTGETVDGVTMLNRQSEHKSSHHKREEVN